MSDIHLLGAAQLHLEFAKGALSAHDIAQATLQKIAITNGTINAFTSITTERALKRAAQLDQDKQNGLPIKPFAAVPYAVKNLFDIKGITTVAGSKAYKDAPPALADAALIERLDEAKGMLMGALNMDEFAYGFTTENTHYGPSHNPWNLDCIAGGSSGGSAAAVAANMVPISLGSDTNGSIRVPASLCGVFGLKPTFGRLSRRGTFPFIASLDHLGPFARSSEDLCLAYNEMQGFDAHDPGFNAPSIRLADVSSAALEALAIKPLRVARLGGFFDQFASPIAQAAAKQAAHLLGAQDEVELPNAATGRAAAFIITNAEGGALHTDLLRTRQDDMEPLSVDRFLAGALLPAQWYLKAQRYRRQFMESSLALFKDWDILIAPATPTTAPKIGTDWIEINGQKLPAKASMGILTQPISFIGLPVAVAPTRLNEPGAMPIGVQIIAAPWREDLALQACALLEQLGFSAHCKIAV